MTIPDVSDSRRQAPQTAVSPERRSGIERRRGEVKWRDLEELHAPVRGRWELAVLFNVACGPLRPKDLVELINQQGCENRPLARPVLTQTVKRLERSGLVTREEVSKIPAESWIRITPWGRDVVAAFDAMHAWWAAQKHLPRPGESARRRLATG